MSLRLYILQRITALVMAPLVIGHIAVMIYAIQGGLSAEEILGRTRGSVLWGGFYAAFVVAVSVHAAIGLRTIAQEWLGISGRGLGLVFWGSGLGLCALGLRAVWAVTL